MNRASADRLRNSFVELTDRGPIITKTPAHLAHPRAKIPSDPTPACVDVQVQGVPT